MSFYLNMAQKYANIRTFSPEDGAGSGDAAAEAAAAAAGNKADDAAAADATAAAAAAAEAEAAAAAATNDATKTDAEKAALLREVMERKAALKEANAKLKEYEGVDVARYRQMIAAEEAAERTAAEAKGDFERVKQMMAEAHAAETQAKEARISELEAEIAKRDGAIDELSVGNAFGNSNFIADSLIMSPAKTRVLYGAHFAVEGGKVVGYDKPAGAADRTMLVDAAGAPLPFDAALTKIIEADPDKETLLRSKAKPGSGSNTDTSAPKVEKKVELTGVAAITAGLKNYAPKN